MFLHISLHEFPIILMRIFFLLAPGCGSTVQFTKKNCYDSEVKIQIFRRATKKQLWWSHCHVQTCWVAPIVFCGCTRACHRLRRVRPFITSWPQDWRIRGVWHETGTGSEEIGKRGPLSNISDLWHRGTNTKESVISDVFQHSFESTEPCLATLKEHPDIEPARRNKSNTNSMISRCFFQELAAGSMLV